MLKLRVITSGPSDGVNRLIESLSSIGVSCSKLRNDVNPKKKLIIKDSIKWGCFTASSKSLEYSKTILNRQANTNVLNKHKCLLLLSEKKLPVVEFTQSKNEAETWLDQNERVYVRAVLCGSGGEGLSVVCPPERSLPDAPLYTKGVKGKRREYRIHVYNHNGVKRFWIQQKLRRSDFSENKSYDNLIRNLDHGWIFAHNDIVAPKDQTIGAAVEACNAFGLNFGAVDVIEVDKGGQPFILEINTAPGLEGATVNFYANCIKDSLSNE